jgi:indolepyruvate ferredoxin oxidoreductase beta subunit
MEKRNRDGQLSMKKPIKILIAGVGGQGVVFLTKLIVEACLIADMLVATSEIHGLAQRGGTVTAGISLGGSTCGFLEKAGVDILIGLEPLEAQRCLTFLNKNSIALIDENRILPYSVNSGHKTYPDTLKFVGYLKNNIKEVIHITEDIVNTKSTRRNLYLMGMLCASGSFPIDAQYIEKAIRKISRSGSEDTGIEIFRKGCEENKVILD